MSKHLIEKPRLWAFMAALAGVAAALPSVADELKVIELQGERSYPESIAASADGTLYVSSLASGGVSRIRPGSSTAEEWVKPGAFDSRSTFGVLVDEKAGLLWVCSNDVSAIGVAGPGTATGSHLKGFDLASGEGRTSVLFPASPAICNDMALAADGSLFVTNSLTPQILKLKPGSTSFEVWLESSVFEQPAQGAGLDGIAFGDDGNLYVNNFTSGAFFRVEVQNGAPGKVTKLAISRPLKAPDGLRPIGGQTFVMAEGGGTLDRVTISGDQVEVETIKDGLSGPTAVALIGGVLWAPEGQLGHLFDPKTGPPSLPFRIVGVPIGK